MSRILLVDDSPHAQRIGERILSDEGYEVATVSHADAALIRLDDVDPDVVLADAVMPGRTGYEICQYIKMNPRHRHVRLILTAGALEPLDDARVRQVGADATLKKPFEATALLAAVKPLAEAALAARAAAGDPRASAGPGADSPAPRSQTPFIAVVDAEQVRAAVTVALDAAMDSMVDEIARRVLAALHTRKSEGDEPAALVSPRRIPLEEPRAALPLPAVQPMDPIRRVTPLRLRSGSLLGVDPASPETPPERAAEPAAVPVPEPLPPPPQQSAAEPPPSPPAESPVSRPQTRVTLLRARPGSILGLDLYGPDPDESPSQPRDDA
jgi:CheY-like chemotaxis protein